MALHFHKAMRLVYWATLIASADFLQSWRLAISSWDRVVWNFLTVCFVLIIDTYFDSDNYTEVNQSLYLKTHATSSTLEK